MPSYFFIPVLRSPYSDKPLCAADLGRGHLVIVSAFERREAFRKMYLRISNDMLDGPAIPDTMFATIVPVLDKPDDWRDWWAYIKDLALHRNVWKYIDPDDETITEEKPTEPTLPVPAKPFIDMDENERLVWQLESEHYDRLERKYDKEHNGLTAVWIAIWTTLGQNHRFVFRRYASVRQLLIKVRDRIAPRENW